MKKILFTLVLCISLAFGSSGQNKNEDLYNAIVSKDKNQVSALIMSNANPNYVRSFSRFYKADMLIMAVKKSDSEIVHILLDHNVDPEWKDPLGRTALMYAAALGKVNIVELLIEMGADISANDGKGYDVLKAAKESSDEETISFVEEKLEAKKKK